ncbi:MAG: SRPBCC family protein [Candidatus Bipolaricaulia bacterium]
MKEIQTEVEIDASAERVWQLLTDFAAFPEWNPFIRRASGKVKTGTRRGFEEMNHALKVRAEQDS